jgi:hypothetical protein
MMNEISRDRAGKHLHLDLSSGVAGDMLLAALLHLGVGVDPIHRALHQVGLARPAFRAERVRRGGLSATMLHVEPSAESQVAHLGNHGEAKRLLAESSLPEGVKKRALSVLERLARAEAAVHGVSVDEVHFHEVGAVDTLVDIVGVATAVETLEPRAVSASPVAVGDGRIETAHGVLPVPAPATLELLKGVPLYGPAQSGKSGLQGELATPTGAALLREYVDTFTGFPALVVEAVGYGAGHRELEGQANVVRAVWGNRVAGVALDDTAREALVEIRATVDDLTPELMAWAAARLRETGAVDVWLESVLMKKSRPGWIIGVLAAPDQRPALVHTLLNETSTLGVRWHPVQREILDRRTVEVETVWGPVAVKEALRNGRVIRGAPEFESCRRIAAQQDVSLRAVYEAACAAHFALRERRREVREKPRP